MRQRPFPSFQLLTTSLKYITYSGVLLSKQQGAEGVQGGCGGGRGGAVGARGVRRGAIAQTAAKNNSKSKQKCHLLIQPSATPLITYPSSLEFDKFFKNYVDSDKHGMN